MTTPAVSRAATSSPETFWCPRLTDRADGVKGHYAIARTHPNGYREVWNLRRHEWNAFSDDVLTLEDAQTLLKAIVIPTAPAAQPASPAPLTDADVKRRTAIAFEATNDSDHVSLFQHWYAKGLREGAALASPQVAPTGMKQVSEKEALKGGRWTSSDDVERMARELYRAIYPDTAPPVVCNLCDIVGEVVGRLKAAAPVQVAPAPAPSDADFEELAYRTASAYRHGTGTEPGHVCTFDGYALQKFIRGIRSLLAERAATPMQAPAAADDARDAIENSEVAVLDAFDLYARQFTYRSHPAKPEHFPNGFPWFKAGYLAAISTPAAKPAEPTQGEQA